MISLWHRTLYVHVPKCGGQSIETAFLSDLGLDWRRHRRLFLCHKRPLFPERWAGPARLAHLRARDYVALGYVPSSLFETLFSFATVRNPFTWLHSHWKFGYASRSGFERFVLRTVPRLVRRGHFFVRPQCDYVTDAEGRTIVDKVVPLEAIEAQWPDIRSRCGVGARLPHVNARAGTPVTWSPGMVETVRELFASDFEAFGYSIEPPRAG